MASEREKALIRDRVARARLAGDPVHEIKQRRAPHSLQHIQRPGRGSHDVPSAAELAVLSLVAEGYKTGEIAGLLCKGEETVRTQLRSAVRKLEARDRTHACVLCVRRGLID